MHRLSSSRKRRSYWIDYSGDKFDQIGTNHSASLVKDGYYQFTDDKGKTTPVLFKKMAGNFFIVEEMVLAENPGDPRETHLFPGAH